MRAAPGTSRGAALAVSSAGATGTLTVEDSTLRGDSAPLGADLDNLGSAMLNDSTVGVIGP